MYNSELGMTQAEGESVTDLAIPEDYAAEIERAADPAAYVIQACERAKVWLAQVLDHGDIDAIVELKSQAEAIRVYTMSKQLGQDAAIAAGEIVRRAERGIGLAIRKGQEAGEIAKRGENPYRGNQYHHPGEAAEERSSKKLPSDFLSKDELAKAAYPMTDNVTPEQFESAISAAKAEGNMTRTNVVRKIQDPTPTAPEPQAAGRNRKPLPDALRDAAVKALRAVEAVHRLTQDDRWPKYAAKVDPLTRDNLRRAVQLLSTTVDSVPSNSTAGE
jgi:hypothetical protein